MRNSRGETVAWLNITVLASMLTLKEMRTGLAPEMQRAAEGLAGQAP